MKIPFFISLLIASLSVAAQQDTQVTVNAVNYPVWVEREQRLIPLAPGSGLQQGDIVQTGGQGRIWLAMPDGSVVKLGQATRFKIDSARYNVDQGNGVLEGALDVIKGAFRFTSGFFSSQLNQSHQINIQVGAVTIGIRGTDIWGRSSDTEDFITLLEGNILVQAEGETDITLDQPLQLYLKKTGQAADEVTMLDTEQIQKLGAETELSVVQGIASVDGEFELVLMSLQDVEIAQQQIDRFQRAGYAVDPQSVTVNDEHFTRLRISGFNDREAATQLALRMTDEFQLISPWVKPRD